MTDALQRRIARRERALSRVKALLIDQLRVPRAPDEIDPDTPLFAPASRSIRSTRFSSW